MSDPITRLNEALDGRYRVEGELGEGGMATVYLADDLKHERKVALKVLKPELAAVVGADRFLAEIKTTANLQHPHILPLFDSGQADSFLFYVMPYIEGETLAERIERDKQLPVDEAVDIATAVAHALQTAHEAGVVHRDIKPGNILLSRGQPLVADFGIALAVGGASGARLTETGLSIGTPYYMSPEQATGDQAVGPSSDTFALACVLYEMLVGEPPYPGTTAQAVLGKIIQGAPVSATSIRSSIPAHVDAAIRKALEKLPADRFKAAGDFAKALGDPGFRHGQEALGAAGSATTWNRVAIGFAASTALLAAALGWSLTATGNDAPRRVERFSLSVPSNQAPDEQINISPDGSMMVFRALNEGGQPQLFLRRWEDLEPEPIADTEGDLHDPVISPDGTEVVFVQDGQLKVAPLQGGLIRTLADEAICCSRWGSDGFIYFSPVGRTISRVPADGGGEVERITEQDQPEDGTHGYFQILPGGRVGVFTVWGPPQRIEAIDMETGERKRVVAGVRSWLTPAGDLVFANNEGRILVAPFDADGMELSGPARPLVDGVGITSASDAMYSVSEEGTLVYWALTSGSVGRGQLVWVARSGEAEVIDPSWQIDFGNAVVSLSLASDGSRVALAEVTDGASDIWVKTLPAGPRSRLTFGSASEWKPRWAPDGETITYLSNRDGGGWRVWSRRADGTGDAELTLDYADVSGDAFFDATGEWMIFRTAGGAGSALQRDILAFRPGVDSVPLPLLAVAGRIEEGPALSPNGRWLAYSSDETGRREVFVRAFPDVESFKTQVSTQGGIKPVWSPLGDELFYVAGVQTNPVMTAVEVEAGNAFRVVGQEPLFPIATEYWANPNIDFYDISPDGRRFIMARRILREGGSETPELILVRNWIEALPAGR